jgi:DNA repair protein RecN (Recombination protein N)
MLKLLEIRQFALIDHLAVEFTEGLNLLTGETGSGKSIIVDALGLLLGEKGYAEMIRSGSEKATISGVFELEDETRLRQKFEENGLEFNPEELIVKRELSQSGKGRAFVNSQVVPIGFLRDAARFLVDIHGQSEQQTLHESEFQLVFVDAFANQDSLLAEVRELYRRWQDVLEKIKRLRKDEQERLRDIDLRTFQLREIEKVNLKSPGEEEDLVSEHARLANADRLFQLSSQSYGELYEAENSASAAIKHAARQLEELCRVDRQCENLLEQLKTARIAIDDVALSLREYSSKIEVNPQRLDWVELRMAEIDRLKRKYGKTISEILSFYEGARRELQNLLTADETLLGLERALLAAARNYRKKGAELSAKRQAAAVVLEKKVEKELAQLAMGRSRFRIAFAGSNDSGLPNDEGAPLPWEKADGVDHIEFLLSPNPGEEVKPLVKIASGGEISRIMLALKSVQAVDGRSKSLVFDEVDSGIGGQTADVVGQKLRWLSKKNQVICVTHLPQIASYADSHYFIAKNVAQGRTVTQVVRLNASKRIQEIARMISGDRMTESVLKHAAELLKSAAE